MVTRGTFNAPETRRLIDRANRRIEADRLARQQNRQSDYTSRDYETDIVGLLNHLFPFSSLSSIRLFSTEPRGETDFGYEMDNILHFRVDGIDFVVIVEAKKQAIRVERSDRWTVIYGDRSKSVIDQIDSHIRTMWQYLGPLARETELKFVAVVCSSERATRPAKTAVYRNAEVHLRSLDSLPRFFEDRFFSGASSAEVLRISQSAFLDLLRLGMPVPQLGHPELASGIKYIERCRRTLDRSLFRLFDPKPERWVINGSAGMGKSVLLAYTAAVLSCEYELHRALDSIVVAKADIRLKEMRFSPTATRADIAIMALSSKQLANIRIWYFAFVAEFQKADTQGVIRFRTPEFVLCKSKESFAGLKERWAALLIDEAHDLPAYASQAISESYAKGNWYLALACDRHQRLRLAGSDAKIVDGLDFTNRSTRLKQIYRNPAPVYIASLALMFRWFATSGPKVIPTLEDLRENFGFRAQLTQTKDVEIALRSDAHPANSWCHTVAWFPDVISAFTALTNEKLAHQEVLWVRFSEEDADFNYEQLNQSFTYHTCRNKDAHKICDKYIKGQDYPVVVIEGFPSFMDRFEVPPGPVTSSQESQMWDFRRELYLCASRATAFLYFVCSVAETEEILRIKEELARLIEATATPSKIDGGGTKSWEFRITKADHVRTMNVFSDLRGETTEINEKVDEATLQVKAPTSTDDAVFGILPEEIEPELPSFNNDGKPTIELPEIITPRMIAALVGETPLHILVDLKRIGIRASRDEPIVFHTAVQIIEQKGFRVQKSIKKAG